MEAGINQLYFSMTLDLLVSPHERFRERMLMRQRRRASAIRASVAIRLLKQPCRADNASLTAAGACSASSVGLLAAENVIQGEAQHAFSLLRQWQDCLSWLASYCSVSIIQKK